MCYSALVVQGVRKLNRQLGLKLDYVESEKLYLPRLEDPSIAISRGFEANFEDPQNDQERRIKGAIDEYRSRLAIKTEKDLFYQKSRLVNAERSLKEKEAKKAGEDVRIASNKIDALTRKLSDIRRSEPASRDNRIFPMVYGGVIIKHGGEICLTPMRYFCRPAGKPAFYDKKYPGLYNARRDNLQKFWSEQFGIHHAIMVVDGFFENVSWHAMQHRELAAGEQPQNVVLQFTPKPAQSMLIACLYSHWTDSPEPGLRGFAAITDEPPADVSAAGHDRCIINLNPKNVDAWLTPENRSTDELQGILSDRAVSLYQHEALQAA